MVFGFLVAAITTALAAIATMLKKIHPQADIAPAGWSETIGKIADFFNNLIVKPGGVFLATGIIELAVGLYLLRH